MQDTAVCCKELTPGAEWPFHRTLVLGWYDGPTSGVVQCGACGAEYTFVMLDWDLHCDDAEDPRIFSLSPLPPGSLEALLRVDPKNPFREGKHGMLFYKWRNAAETLPNEAFQQIQQQFGQILAQADTPERLVAWIRPGDPMLAARELNELDGYYIRELLSVKPHTLPIT